MASVEAKGEGGGGEEHLNTQKLIRLMDKKLAALNALVVAGRDQRREEVAKEDEAPGNEFKRRRRRGDRSQEVRNRGRRRRRLR